MVSFDVDLHFLVETVAREKAVNRGNIEIILMLRRLHGFRLNQDRALETDLVLVLDDQIG